MITFFDIWGAKPVWGGSVGYGYDSLFGPLEASLGYSSRSHKVGFYVNLGYVFLINRFGNETESLSRTGLLCRRPPDDAGLKFKSVRQFTHESGGLLSSVCNGMYQIPLLIG